MKVFGLKIFGIHETGNDNLSMIEYRLTSGTLIWQAGLASTNSEKVNEGRDYFKRNLKLLGCLCSSYKRLFEDARNNLQKLKRDYQSVPLPLHGIYPTPNIDYSMAFIQKIERDLIQLDAAAHEAYDGASKWRLDAVFSNTHAHWETARSKWDEANDFLNKKFFPASRKIKDDLKVEEYWLNHLINPLKNNPPPQLKKVVDDLKTAEEQIAKLG